MVLVQRARRLGFRVGVGVRVRVRIRVRFRVRIRVRTSIGSGYYPRGEET